MSLFMPLGDEQFHPKPMAISTITSPVSLLGGKANNTSPTLSSPSNHSSQVIEETSGGSSSTKSDSSFSPSQAYSNYSSSSSCSLSGSPNYSSSNSNSRKNNTLGINGSDLTQQSSIMASSYYQFVGSHIGHSNSSRHHASSSMSSNTSSRSITAPLSLHERRLRNKTASAKYRAKKNQQQGEMRAMISSLTKENELLLRQLDHTQHENNYLRTTCDRLRGKIMAQKMLKQYLVEAEQHQRHEQVQPYHHHHHHQQQQHSIPEKEQQPNCFARYHNISISENNNAIKSKKYVDLMEEK